MAKKFVRNRITWVAYILLAIYAYFLNILGPITPFLHDELNLSYTVSSLHFSAFAVGILVIGLGGHFLIQRTGRVRALSLGATGLGIGALLLVAGKSPIITIAASFLMGCVGSLILAVVPTLLSEEHGEMRAVAISEANVLSSLVASFASLLVGWFSGLVIGWRLALILAALVALGIGASLFRAKRSGATQQTSIQAQQSLPGLYWWYWVALVFAVAIEFCMIFWSADYMELELGTPRTSAVQTVSLFLGGMIVGRLVSSRLLQYLPVHVVVLGSLLLGLFGFVIYWSTSNALVGTIGLAITGLGVASLYPLILSIAIGSAGANETQAGARASLASGVAILILPLVLGRVADLAGLREAFMVIAVLFGALLLMMLGARRLVAMKAAQDVR